MKHIFVLIVIGIFGIAGVLLLIYTPQQAYSPVLSATDEILSPSVSFYDLVVKDTPADRVNTSGALLSPDIFFDSYVPDSKSDNIRSIIATGDVLLARSVNARTVGRKDFTWPFHKTYQILRDADITLINLETPLVEPCPVRTDGMVFCGDRANIAGLEFAGVDVVNIANNHIGNYGEEGVRQTIESIQTVGMQTSGTPHVSVADIRGLKFAFIGFSEFPQTGILSADVKNVIEHVRKAAGTADVVIASFHWGTEYTRIPTEFQKQLGRLAIDQGADLIVGNHPHWWQPVEIYNGKLIMYSHGNFVFDQEWSEETKVGIVGKYYFFDDQLIDAEFFPVRIVDYGQPYFLEGEEKIKVLNQLSSGI